MRSALKKIRRSRERVIYGWYSQKQAKIGGEIVYEKVNGEHVLVTEISDGPCPCGRWNDYKSKGFMSKFIDRVSHGEFGETQPLVLMDYTPEPFRFHRNFYAMAVCSQPSIIARLTCC